MLKLKKYVVYFSLFVSLLGVLFFSNKVSADEASNNCESCHAHTFNNAGDASIKEWEKEVIVKLDSEEDFYNYKINPNYKYVFIWETPSLARAVCYNCGKSNMGLIKRKEQYGGDDRMCPIAPAALYNDYFVTWHTYTYERCTACGYESEGFDLVKTYSAFCANEDNPIDGSMWEVKAEYTTEGGYDPHQCLAWWLYYER